MKTTAPKFVPFLLFIFTLCIAVPGYAQQQERIGDKTIKSALYKGQKIEYVAGQIAVKLAPGASAAQITSILKQLGADVIDPFDKLGWALIESPKGEDIFKFMEVLQDLPLITAAEPNAIGHIQIAPNDPYFGGSSPATYAHQWGLHNNGQSPPGGTPGADINAPEAWDVQTGSSNVVIAVLDTGIPMQQDGDGDWDEYDLSHPDLDDTNKIILGPDYVDDGSGVRDLVGHGTHVAGIAAAETNNGIGVAGVCWNCKLLIIQVSNRFGQVSAQDFYDGVVHAVDYSEANNLGLVINASLGWDAPLSQLEDAIDYTRDHYVSVVAAAGNDYGGPVLYPAAYSANYDNVIAVSSTNASDNLSVFSNVGPEVVVAAPGGNDAPYSENDIFSTTPNYPFSLEQRGVSQNYGYLAGTSMATPHVAGTIGLMLSEAQSFLYPSTIRNQLENTATDLGPSGFDNQFGHGRIRADLALDFYTNVSIGGNTCVEPNHTGYWFANTTGNAPITVQWLRRCDGVTMSGGNGIAPMGPSCEDGWTLVGGGYEYTYTPSQGEDDFVLRAYAYDSDGDESNDYETVRVGNCNNPTLRSVEKTPDTSLPKEVVLYQNAPNPVVQAATIRYGLPEATRV